MKEAEVKRQLRERIRENSYDYSDAVEEGASEQVLIEIRNRSIALREELKKWNG